MSDLYFEQLGSWLQVVKMNVLSIQRCATCIHLTSAAVLTKFSLVQRIKALASSDTLCTFVGKTFRALERRIRSSIRLSGSHLPTRADRNKHWILSGKTTSNFKVTAR